MLNTKNNFKALSLSTESEVLNSSKLHTCSNEKGRSMIEMLGVLAIIGVLSVGGIAGYSKAMLKYKTNKTIDQITMLTTNIRTLYAQQDTFNGLDGTVVTDAKAGVANSRGAEEPAFIAMGVVPDEMIVKSEKTVGAGDSRTGRTGAGWTANSKYDDTSLENPFSGSVTITVDNSVPGPAGTDGAFIVGVNGIPKEACMAMATSDWGSNYSSGLIGMALSNTDDTPAASYLVTTGTKKIYAGGDCSETSDTANAFCSKKLPIQVSAAAAACACTGSECSVAFKYY